MYIIGLIGYHIDLHIKMTDGFVALKSVICMEPGLEDIN